MSSGTFSADYGLNHRDKHPMTSVAEVNEAHVNDHPIQLAPNRHLQLTQHFDMDSGYNRLHTIAQSHSGGSFLDIQPLDKTHREALRPELHEAVLASMLEKLKGDAVTALPDHSIRELLEQILTSQVDEKIANYFKSHYMVFSVTGGGDTNTWHCDEGPSAQLKLIVYLNDSDIAVLGLKETRALKEIGYIYSDKHQRQKNIQPLLDTYKLDNTEETLHFKAGEALLFNPVATAYCAPVEAGKVITLTLLPSPVSWRDVFDNTVKPFRDEGQFEGIPDLLVGPADAQKNAATIDLDAQTTVECDAQLKYTLRAIFSDTASADLFFERIHEFDPQYQQVKTVLDVLNLMKSSFQQSINWNGAVEAKDVQNFSDLCAFERNWINSKKCYGPQDKPNPNAVYWPNPSHPHHPRSKYEETPVALKHKIMNAKTPVGSAGSCFASEISYALQSRNFNYIVTERADNPAEGVIVDCYKAGDKYAHFCANYGIQFNTPSFRQLAEKAFGTRKFEKLLIQQENGLFVDPYRESVFFTSRKAYLADYEKHVEAIRNALTQCEVFIITLGLNECWQLSDGSVIARNPRYGLHPFAKHTVLTVEENIENVQTFYDLIKKHNPAIKLIISVSPVPFLATGLAETSHVIAANTHSKAVLRVAAESLVNSNDDMFYLPSYELITECIKEPFTEDHRHIKKSAVARVIDMFEDIFVENGV